jgi:hypothetical protein
MTFLFVRIVSKYLNCSIFIYAVIIKIKKKVDRERRTEKGRNERRILQLEPAIYELGRRTCRVVDLVRFAADCAKTCFPFDIQVTREQPASSVKNRPMFNFLALHVTFIVASNVIQRT